VEKQRVTLTNSTQYYRLDILDSGDIIDASAP
jgi:hypothetical protein